MSCWMAQPCRACKGMENAVYVVLRPPFGFYTITMPMYYNFETTGVPTIWKSGAKGLRDGGED